MTTKRHVRHTELDSSDKETIKIDEKTVNRYTQTNIK